MSGIAGFVNLDGAPADPSIFAAMMEAILFRGPDGNDSWIGESACLGHTLLKTTNESEGERQPLSIDGNTWIVADARIDAREELLDHLKAGGEDVRPGVADVELILRAWRVWQEDCVDHLLGDFAFAIWDSSRGRLFCARDQMGIKPLYYAAAPGCVVFSNTLNCVRRHPAVSGRLNDQAIADFLLFDRNDDITTTVFADIRKIPPAHCAVWERDTVRLRRYWTLPIDEPIFYRRPQDYVVRFRDLLQAAVSDRLRIDRVGVLMGGGLDSPSLAATARDLLRVRSGKDAVRAFTVVYDQDEERDYAGMVASHLEIPIEFDDNSAAIDLDWYEKSLPTPEPASGLISLAWSRAYHRRMAQHSRVVLFGEGPDNALGYEWRSYLSYILKQRRYVRLMQDVILHSVTHKKIPLKGLWGLLRRGLLGRKPGEHSTNEREPVFPQWLNQDLENRLQLRFRWQEKQQQRISAHPVRPGAYQSFGSPLWQHVFANFDPERSAACLEVRHPFLDLRLLRYMLAVPVVPWCRSKYLLRRSMRGVLPEAVLRRPKTPVLNDFWEQEVIANGLPRLSPAEGLTAYVDVSLVAAIPDRNPESFWADFRVRCLDYWLKNHKS